MNIKQVKEEAKKRFGKDITDEQAQAWLDAHPTGKIQDEELENVAGGGCHSPGGWLITTIGNRCDHFVCKHCGHDRPGIHPCGVICTDGYDPARRPICKNCKYCEYGGSWLCKHPANRS